MAKPTRIHGPGTFFVTSPTYMRGQIFAQPAFAELFIETLAHYRSEGHYRLYAFVVMPDHIHLLLKPSEDITLERALQYIKGGFSRKIESKFPVWQRGFTDHRIRDLQDFLRHKDYIHHNPVRAQLCARPEDYRFSSAYSKPTSAAEAAAPPKL